MQLTPPTRDRDWLRLAVSIAVLVMWFVSGMVALYTGDVRVFLGASAPFSALVGVVLGIRITRNGGR